MHLNGGAPESFFSAGEMANPIQANASQEMGCWVFICIQKDF